MKEYVENMAEYVENMKKYFDILDLALLYLHNDMDLGTWKNSTPELPSELWDLKKFHLRASS